MGPVELVLLLATAVAVAGVARRLRVAAPLILVAAGLVLSLVPGVPEARLNPEIVLLLVLPPLLYSAALESSYVGIRANLRPIALLSVGLVLFTTLVVGLVTAWLVPGLPLPVAFALGAIVAPPDAVAAMAVGRELGLPRRLMTILAGESLVNDATALTAYRVAVAAAVGGTVSAFGAVGTFLYAVVGSVALGLVFGLLLSRLLGRLRDPVLENAINLIAPFLAYVVGEVTHTSGVLVVVLCGLVVAHRGARTLSFATRLQMESVWRVLVFVLEAVVFLLIGLQLPTVVSGLGTPDWRWLAGVSAAVLATVIVTRIVWVFPATYLPRLVPAVAARDPNPSWRAVAVLSWAGMRGVVSLAAAFGLPLSMDDGSAFPDRELVVFLTFVVVIGTLVLQGLSLPWLIRRLGVTGVDPTADVLAEAAAVGDAAKAGLARLDELVASGEATDDVVDRLRTRTQVRVDAGWERLGRQDRETPSAAYRRLRRAMIDAERQELERARDEGRLADEVLREARRDLDFEEALLARD